jgi:hypothetical protein
MEIKTNFTTSPLSLAREENPVVYKESIRSTNFEMRFKGYQNIRLSGGGYQDIGTTGSRRASFLILLTSWSSDVLHPDLRVT